MNLLLLCAYGIAIGFSIGITIGPVAVLCLQQSIMDSWRMGATVGIGASLVHLFYATIAVFSVSLVDEFFIKFDGWIKLIAAFFILYIAACIARGHFTFDHQKYQKISYATALFSMIIINLSSIVSISSYVTIMGVFKIFIHTAPQAFFFLAGIFAGNLTWWLGLATISHFLKPYLSPAYLRWVNPVAATFLFILGVSTLIAAIFALWS